MSVIKAIYGLKGGIQAQTCSNNDCTWDSIMNSVMNFTNKGQDINSFLRMKIDIRDNTSF